MDVYARFQLSGDLAFSLPVPTTTPDGCIPTVTGVPSDARDALTATGEASVGILAALGS